MIKSVAKNDPPNYGKIAEDALSIGSGIMGLISSFSKKNKKSKENNSMVNRTIKNNQRVSGMFSGPNTADITTTASQYLNEAINNPMSRGISTGDKMIKDNFNKYNRVMTAASNEMNGFRYSTLPKKPSIDFSPPNTSSRNVINNASMMFTRTDTENTIVIIKAISGMVATMGGDLQISEILTHIVKKRYAYDATNIYNTAMQENWVALAAALISLVQKLYMDQDEIIAQLEKIVGKQATQQFARQWKQQQVPFVGATMMAGNMLNSIKGIITPRHLR
jgi:hypothetical protein